MATTNLITYAANAVWITCLIAGAVTLIAKLMTRCSAAHRHALWTAALIFSSVLPVATLWNRQGVQHDTVGNAFSATDPRAVSPELTQTTSQRAFWLKMRRPLPPVSFAPMVTGLLSILYLGFIAYRCLCLFWSWQTARRIFHGATPCLLPQESTILRNFDSALETARVSLVCSQQVHAPCVLGFLRPLLVLPDWFTMTCSEEQIASALWHEMAHVRRHDFLLNLMYEFLLLPLSFHPAAWFIKKQIEHTRELACDEIAAKQVPVYARSLVRIAQQITMHSGASRPIYALSLFDTNALEERIMNLLSKKDNVRNQWMQVRLMLAACLFAVTCVAASLVSIQVAMAAAPEDGARFVGSWRGKFKDKTFVTVTLASKDGKVSGTVSRLSFEMDASGNLTQASALDGEDEIADTTPQGNALHLATKAKGKLGGSDASVEYDMTLTGEDGAELQVDGAPPGMPAPKPWKLERAITQK